METRPIDNQPRRRLRDYINHVQPVLLKRSPRLYEVHNSIRQSEQWRQLHRSGQSHYLDRYSPALKILCGDSRVLRRHANRSEQVVVFTSDFTTTCHCDPAASKPEIQRFVHLCPRLEEYISPAYA